MDLVGNCSPNLSAVQKKTHFAIESKERRQWTRLVWLSARPSTKMHHSLYLCMMTPNVPTPRVALLIFTRCLCECLMNINYGRRRRRRRRWSTIFVVVLMSGGGWGPSVGDFTVGQFIFTYLRVGMQQSVAYLHVASGATVKDGWCWRGRSVPAAVAVQQRCGSQSKRILLLVQWISNLLMRNNQ